MGPESFQGNGPIPEIACNRKHPAFDDIFGAVNTVDEDVNSLSRQEVLERLTRATNAAKERPHIACHARAGRVAGDCAG